MRSIIPSVPAALVSGAVALVTHVVPSLARAAWPPARSWREGVWGSRPSTGPRAASGKPKEPATGVRDRVHACPISDAGPWPSWRLPAQYFSARRREPLLPPGTSLHPVPGRGRRYELRVVARGDQIRNRGTAGPQPRSIRQRRRQPGRGPEQIERTVSQLPLSSSHVIFELDGDGICSPEISFAIAGCPFGPSGYEGPGTAFEASSNTEGVVRFNPGLAPGASAYFSLEAAVQPQSLTVPPPSVTINRRPAHRNAPEVSSLHLQRHSRRLLRMSTRRRCLEPMRGCGLFQRSAARRLGSTTLGTASTEFKRTGVYRLPCSGEDEQKPPRRSAARPVFGSLTPMRTYVRSGLHHRNLDDAWREGNDLHGACLSCVWHW
jgi:hypothetical protein